MRHKAFLSQCQSSNTLTVLARTVSPTSTLTEDSLLTRLWTLAIPALVCFTADPNSRRPEPSLKPSRQELISDGEAAPDPSEPDLTRPTPLSPLCPGPRVPGCRATQRPE